MLIHLVLFLVKQLSKSSAPAPAPTRHRKQETGEIVVDCPMCGNLAVSMQYSIDESSGKLPQDWKHVNDVIACGACGQALEADAFENDGTGVMRVKRWTCAACGTVNSQLNFTCSTCKGWNSGGASG